MNQSNSSIKRYITKLTICIGFPWINDPAGHNAGQKDHKNYP